MTAVDIEQVRWFDPDPRGGIGAGSAAHWDAILAAVDAVNAKIAAKAVSADD